MTASIGLSRINASSLIRRDVASCNGLNGVNVKKPHKSLAAVLAFGLISAHSHAAKPVSKPAEHPSREVKVQESDEDKPVNKHVEHSAPSLPTDVLINTPAVVNANFHSPVSQVPEADAMIMALAGVGVVGGLLWRRRQTR
jgi:hypothetical protein